MSCLVYFHFLFNCQFTLFINKEYLTVAASKFGQAYFGSLCGFVFHFMYAIIGSTFYEAYFVATLKKLSDPCGNLNNYGHFGMIYMYISFGDFYYYLFIYYFRSV